MAAENVEATVTPEEAQTDPPITTLQVSPTYIELSLGQTISTGDYGSIRPEFKAGFRVPAGVDIDKYITETLYPWARWVYIWLVRKQLMDHTSLRDNIHQWVTDFFKKFASAPNLIVTARKAIVGAAKKVIKGE